MFMGSFFTKLFRTVSCASVVLLAAGCGGGGGTSIKQAPENLTPIVTAMTASTFSPWDSASSVFLSGSNGEKKWSALKMQQKMLFENGDADSLYYWTSTEKDGWSILRFCSDQLEENECSSYDKAPEVHLKLVDGKVTEMRMFEDAMDETKAQPEVLVYQVTSSNPDFGAADFKIDSAISKNGGSDKPVTCFYGKIVLDSEIVSIVEEVYLPVRLYMSAKSPDGVSLEPTSGTSGIIETRSVNSAVPFTACFEYPGSEINQLTIEAGKFRLTVAGSSIRNTSEIAILLKSTAL
jgi:hypothetical protein